LLENVPPEVAATIANLDSASALADFVAGVIDAKPSEKQEVLETIDIKERLDKVLGAPGAAHRGAQAVEADRQAARSL
jgi:ATP-dependent Lon protease